MMNKFKFKVDPKVHGSGSVFVLDPDYKEEIYAQLEKQKRAPLREELDFLDIWEVEFYYEEE